MLFGPKIPAVTVKSLHELSQSGQKFYLLDVRTTQEYEQGHLTFTNALIPYDQLEQQVVKLPADKQTPIYCFCRAGRRSAFSTKFLRSIGYEKAFNVSGGILAWIDAGYETSPPVRRGDGDSGLKDEI
jgi:rhodanese-related sulfurtransferase